MRLALSLGGDSVDADRSAPTIKVVGLNNVLRSFPTLKDKANIGFKQVSK